MNNVNDNIRKNLIRLRKTKKLTQMDLADNIGYSDKTVSKWETGESVPNVETLCKLAEFYEISLDMLVRGTDEDFAARSESVKKSRYNKLIITLLAISVVWILAVSMYIYVMIFSGENHWILFVAPVPISAIIALVFNSIWGNRRLNYAVITVLLWSMLATIHLTILCYSPHNIYLIYVLGVPLQIAIILWSGLRRVDKKKKETFDEE